MGKEMASDNKACKNIKSKLKDTGERIIPGDPAFNYSFQHHLIAYEWALGFCDGKNVLDVGSGDGYGCSLLAEKAAKVVGIDSSAEAIQHARERYQAENLFFQKADAYSLPFENLSFDVVCSFQVIEHLKYPEKHLQEIKRVLTEDGVLLLSTPNRVQFGGEFHLKIPFHYREFTPPELETLLKKHFVQVEIFGLWGGA